MRLAFTKPPPHQLSPNTCLNATWLFAAHTEKSEGWAQARRILMLAFGPLAIESMFDSNYITLDAWTLVQTSLIRRDMCDIASQLILKWAREGPDRKILVADRFSRLTLDTEALCERDIYV